MLTVLVSYQSWQILISWVINPQIEEKKQGGFAKQAGTQALSAPPSV